MHSGQCRAWDSRARFVFVLAGAQSGKTSWGPWWLLREIAERGPGDYLAVTATYDLFKLKMLPALRDCFEDRAGWGTYRPSERVIDLSDPATGKRGWARIILRSASSGGGLESTTAKAAWLDECGQEAFTLETWEAVLRRLSLNRGRVLGTTTPYNLGWLKREVHDRWERGDPSYEVVRFASTANPAFPVEEFERARATMPAWRFALFYKGEFTRPPGLVFDCFDERVHVVEAPDPADGRPQWIGIDFGAVHTACIQLDEDPASGRFTVVAESLRGGMTTAQHASLILGELGGARPAGCFGGAPGEDQARRDFTAAGLAVQRPPIADVESGIDRITELLRTGKLVVGRNCTGLLEELRGYRRTCSDDGSVGDAIQDRNRFHRIDALRYAVAGITGGRPGVVRGFWR